MFTLKRWENALGGQQVEQRAEPPAAAAVNESSAADRGDRGDNQLHTGRGAPYTS